MHIPSRGFIVGDAASLINPHKIGRVMWSQSPKGFQVPLDLHNQLSEDDEEALDRVLKILLATRQVRGAMDLVYAHGWDRMDLIKPWLMASMETRAQARAMQASGEWREFWNVRE